MSFHLFEVDFPLHIARFKCYNVEMLQGTVDKISMGGWNIKFFVHKRKNAHKL